MYHLLDHLGTGRENLLNDVFISYASEDLATIAQPIADSLAAYGVRVWFDRTNLAINEQLEQAISRGIETRTSELSFCLPISSPRT